MKFHYCSDEALRKRIQFHGYQSGWGGRRQGRDFHHIQPSSLFREESS
jgi:hypothetical protein